MFDEKMRESIATISRFSLEDGIFADPTVEGLPTDSDVFLIDLIALPDWKDNASRPG
jgi:hypothetical protein